MVVLRITSAMRSPLTGSSLSSEAPTPCPRLHHPSSPPCPLPCLRDVSLLPPRGKCLLRHPDPVKGSMVRARCPRTNGFADDCPRRALRWHMPCSWVAQGEDHHETVSCDRLRRLQVRSHAPRASRGPTRDSAGQYRHRRPFHRHRDPLPGASEPHRRARHARLLRAERGHQLLLL